METNNRPPGEWSADGRCSICDAHAPIVAFSTAWISSNYCPNCGAYMRAGRYIRVKGNDDISPATLKIYGYITRFMLKKNYSPTTREIADGLHYASTSTVHRHLEKLKDLNLICYEETKPRTITIPGIYFTDGRATDETTGENENAILPTGAVHSTGERPTDILGERGNI